MVEAFPDESASRYLIRERDRIYGAESRQRVNGMGIEEVITAARGLWQNPFTERVVGSLRRECLNHVIVLNENHIRRVLKSYSEYCHRSRPHLALSKETPEPRAKQPTTRFRSGDRDCRSRWIAPSIRAAGSLTKSLEIQDGRAFWRTTTISKSTRSNFDMRRRSQEPMRSAL